MLCNSTVAAKTTSLIFCCSNFASVCLLPYHSTCNAFLMDLPDIFAHSEICQFGGRHVMVSISNKSFVIFWFLLVCYFLVTTMIAEVLFKEFLICIAVQQVEHFGYSTF